MICEKCRTMTECEGDGAGNFFQIGAEASETIQPRTKLTVAELERTIILQAYELAEANKQLDRLIKAVDRYLPFVPNMKPVGAAKHAESNVRAWELRQTLAAVKEHTPCVSYKNTP
jgi:hypothetical protein